MSKKTFFYAFVYFVVFGVVVYALPFLASGYGHFDLEALGLFVEIWKVQYLPLLFLATVTAWAAFLKEKQKISYVWIVFALIFTILRLCLFLEVYMSLASFYQFPSFVLVIWGIADFVCTVLLPKIISVEYEPR